MLASFFDNNPDCLIICPSFYASFLAKIKDERSLSFDFLSLEEVEEKVKNSSQANEYFEGRSIYILHYDCGPKISGLLGEFRNMSISYFPKGLVKEIDDAIAENRSF